MLNINSEIFTNPIIIVVLVLAIILLFVGFILVYFFVIKRRRQVRTVKEFEKRYNETHEKLTEDIEHSISRLESISNQNTEYIQYFEKYQPMYIDTLKDNDRESFVAISGLKRTIEEKKYSGIKNLIDSTKLVVANFENKVNALNEELTALLQKDEEFHQNIIQLQRSFRSIKENYQEHETELKMMENSFNSVFNKIEKLFKEYEDLANGAHYEEANEKLPTIKQVLDALIQSFDKYPLCCSKISIIIPKRINDVQAKYEELEANDYPLHHLKIMSKIEDYRLRLEELSKKLCAFKIKGVEEEIEEIDKEILELFNKFIDEENAKKYYDENCENVYNATFNLENQYKKINRSLPDYKKVYQIKDKYLNKVEELRRDIDNIQNIKRDLDNYIHSNSKQPYSIISNKIKEMDKEMVRVNEIIVDYNSYLVSLKTDTEYAYKTICEYYVQLEDAEYKLREMAVPSYSSRLKDSFDMAYKFLNHIGDIIKVRPINVSDANDILLKAKEHIDSLLQDILEQVGQMEYAENSIVYANRYSQGIDECKQALISAGTSFFEGDFTRSIDETVAIVKKMDPKVIGDKR